MYDPCMKSNKLQPGRSPLKTENLTKIHRKKMLALCGENYFSFTAIHGNSYVIFRPNFDPGPVQEQNKGQIATFSTSIIF